MDGFTWSEREREDLIWRSDQKKQGSERQKIAINVEIKFLKLSGKQ